MKANANSIRILAVDDHPLVRQGIAALLAVQQDMTLVGEASNGRDAIQQFRALQPDVTLMDLQMPEMNGIDAIIAIRNEFPEARIIVLTTYVGDVQILRALKAGARGYLLKNLLHKELLDTIRAVHEGKKNLSPDASYQLAEHATDDLLGHETALPSSRQPYHGCLETCAYLEPKAGGAAPSRSELSFRGVIGRFEQPSEQVGADAGGCTCEVGVQDDVRYLRCVA